MLTPYTGKITHNDIYYSLRHYGTPMISPIFVGEGRILPVDDLVLEVLEKTEDFRELSALPFILEKHLIVPTTFAAGAIARRIPQQTGYLCDFTLAHRAVVPDARTRLATARNELLSFRDERPTPLLRGIHPYMWDVYRNNDAAESIWNVIGCLDPAYRP